jgi:glycogen debranching enzyme
LLCLHPFCRDVRDFLRRDARFLPPQRQPVIHLCQPRVRLHAGQRVVQRGRAQGFRARHGVLQERGHGVEIEALWYSLLAHLEDIHKRRGEEDLARRWGAKKRLAGTTFLERFWLPDGNFGVGGFLADTWKDGVVDRAMRTNMVIAAALEWSPLSRENRADIVRAAKTELLVPRGLRTLEPRDPRYRGHFAGTPEERDLAYHQGTVWPWLLGFWCEAYLRAFGREEPRLERVRAVLREFDDTVASAGLLHVSEVADGDPPHRPGGTIAQAWNTAEILRAWSLVEEPVPPKSTGVAR